MLSKSTLSHLRIPFSVFLLPIFFFALFSAKTILPINAYLVFIIWHLFIYPASNGYNSYFDKDEGSIALIKFPAKTTIELYYFSLFLDLLGTLLAFFISIEFAICVLIYGILSKMYSHPSIRLKKYPIISFLTVAVFQGSFVYISSLAAINNSSIVKVFSDNLILESMICFCIIGASYPLTQIYQYEEDTKRGDKTLSIVLGKKGSFYFSGILYLFALVMLAKLHAEAGNIILFWLFILLTTPVFSFFLYWYFLVSKNEENANYTYMMRMTILSGACMLIYFVALFIWKIYLPK